MLSLESFCMVDLLDHAVKNSELNYVRHSSNELTYVFIQFRSAFFLISEFNVWRNRACDNADVPIACNRASLNFNSQFVSVSDVKKVIKPSSLEYVRPSEIIDDNNPLSTVTVPPFKIAWLMDKIVASGYFFSISCSKARFSCTRSSENPYALAFPGTMCLSALQLEIVTHDLTSSGNSVGVSCYSFFIRAAPFAQLFDINTSPPSGIAL